jgi:plasmid stabilization system protein ParE
LKSVQLTPAARSDISSAARWYEYKRDGLGDEFLDRVDEALAAIERNSQGYALAFEGLRRCNLKQFPYSLWFELREDNSLVVACLAGKRDMRLVKERARGIISMPNPPEPS